MIYQIFSIILTALFLMFVFWALWYIAIPLLIVAIIFSAFGLSMVNHTCRNIKSTLIINLFVPMT